ncbi:unnamed protein product [Owenia fusiformis]|uniref:Golgi apparatus protein 1 n=1 Tax=Owenia fusiformis TaxID=6347 RepID=A0A8S4NFL9_OWEFU|nr:unnamed protein product [Owenia fusiformis]
MAALRRGIFLCIISSIFCGVLSEPRNVAGNKANGQFVNNQDNSVINREKRQKPLDNNNIPNNFNKIRNQNPGLNFNKNQGFPNAQDSNNQNYLNAAGQQNNRINPQGRNDNVIQNRPFGNNGPPKVMNQNQRFNEPPRKNPVVKISETPQCAADVQRLCSKNLRTNNFAILECLQNDADSKGISETCQHFVWGYKKNLTNDERFDTAAHEFPDCGKLEPGKGWIISCLIEHKENLTNENCKQFLNKMASIIFGDYRLICNFMDKCQKDVESNSCGRLAQRDEVEDALHSQGETIKCLSEHVGTLQDTCKHEILRIAELQADDFHLDRALYYACRDAREQFCKKTKAGGGKVFKCLFRHKFDKDMNTECRSALVTRQKLVAEDYKVSHGLVAACSRDIRAAKCAIRLQDQGMPDNKHVRLSHVLLCLEASEKGGERVSPECLAEMRDWRRALMEDYRISPDIVKECAKEIMGPCKGIHKEGRTLHCLMDLARPHHNRETEIEISNTCLRAIEDLIEEADAGEDFRVDPALQEVCQPVVETQCKDVKPGDANVLNCLMELLGSDKMLEDCEERLLEIQFFVARDFKLDPRLFRKCRRVAQEVCQVDVKKWFEKKTVEDEAEMAPKRFLLACLHNHAKRKQLDRACAFEVKRVMHQRAANVDLEPRIETPCLADLGAFCSDDVEKGEEVRCLQDHMDELAERCQWAVGNYTEDEDEDPGLDRILMKACTPMIKKFCEDLLDNDATEAGEVMECLIKYKHHSDMNTKCTAGIEHHQIVTLKDYRFSYKFKEACKQDVLTNCRGMKRKADVVVCMSEILRNDTLLEQDHRISKPCRKQMKVELLQRGEDIHLDPFLEEACGMDVNRFCKKIEHGKARVVECLKKHQDQLTASCKKKLFKREQLEMKDNSVDYSLMSFCKRMINHFCKEETGPSLLSCLKKYKDEEEFDAKCRKVIITRQEIQNLDYRLNPQLKTACKRDIPKFCKDVTDNEPNDKDLEGKVINCLKIKFRGNRLSRDCEDNIREVIKEAALDYRQDPMLINACKAQITEHCLDSIAVASDGSDDGKGGVINCLKKTFEAKKITDPQCQKQIIRLLLEGKADVHVDPLLYKACSLDIKHFCYNVPQGEGRQMSCLLAALEDKGVRLKPECNKMLEERVQMWEYAAKVAPPETMGELMDQISSSPAKNYFLGIIFAIIGFLFIAGLFCGRVTKRVPAGQKNK